MSFKQCFALRLFCFGDLSHVIGEKVKFAFLRVNGSRNPFLEGTFFLGFGGFLL